MVNAYLAILTACIEILSAHNSCRSRFCSQGWQFNQTPVKALAGIVQINFKLGGGELIASDAISCGIRGLVSGRFARIHCLTSTCPDMQPRQRIYDYSCAFPSPQFFCTLNNSRVFNDQCFPELPHVIGYQITRFLLAVFRKRRRHGI